MIFLDQFTLFPTAASGATPVAPGDVANTMHLWHDANVGVLKTGGSPAGDGEAVVTWQDQSGAARHATMSASPTKVAANASFNGQPTVRCSNAYGTLAPSGLSQPFTSFHVCKLNPGWAVPSRIVEGGGVNILAYGSSYRLQAGGSVFVGSTDENPRAIGIRWNGASTTARLDGVSTVVSPGTSGVSGTHRLAVDASTTLRTEIDFAEIIYYEGALSDSDFYGLEAWLAAKYGITLPS